MLAIRGTQDSPLHTTPPHTTAPHTTAPHTTPPHTTPLHTTAWMLTATLLLVRLLPAALQPGMFFDGVLHATIARNMAAGEGDLWRPVWFGPKCDYHEQPTLAFWLESLFFRVFGDHFWVEKLYSVLLAIGMAGLIAATWRHLLRDRPLLARCSWLPIVLWASLPGWAWIYDSNMLENTLGLFALASVYALLRAADSPRLWLAWTAAAAGCLTAAVLSKGPVGLYPLAAPLCLALTLERERARRMLAIGEGFLLMFLLFFGLLLLQNGAHEYLTKYFQIQVVSSLAGARETVHSAFGRFYIIREILQQVKNPLLIALGLFYWQSRRTGHGFRRQIGADTAPLKSPIWFCSLMAACASLPIIVSPKQFSHYAFPSYPFYAMALGLWCVPTVLALFARDREGAVAAEDPLDMRLSRSHRRLRWLAGGAAAIVVLATCFLAGRPHRDFDVYHDTLAIGRIVPAKSRIRLQPDMSLDYAMQCYLGRWCDIASGATYVEAKYCLGPPAAPDPPGYRAVPADLRHCKLFARIDTNSARLTLGDHPPRQ